MTTPSKRLLAVLVGIAGTVADVETTFWSTRRGAVEVNPVMRLAMYGGRPGVYFFRAAALAFVYRVSGAQGLLGLGVFGLALAANNLVQVKVGEWFHS